MVQFHDSGWDCASGADFALEQLAQKWRRSFMCDAITETKHRDLSPTLKQQRQSQVSENSKALRIDFAKTMLLVKSNECSSAFSVAVTRTSSECGNAPFNAVANLMSSASKPSGLSYLSKSGSRLTF